ncbi:hypothetical protein Syun_027272 [Stephania yunnanensis]|uniref:Transmembrane protein n=1 Tax=Stephania yunnanensis TaxID=152371 RepID=A0AAP0EFC5_9MAGN
MSGFYFQLKIIVRHRKLLCLDLNINFPIYNKFIGPISARKPRKLPEPVHGSSSCPKRRNREAKASLFRSLFFFFPYLLPTLSHSPSPSSISSSFSFSFLLLLLPSLVFTVTLPFFFFSFSISNSPLSLYQSINPSNNKN